MAISGPLVAKITGKVLIQIEGSEPVEVGTVEIPIHVSTEPPKHTRDRSVPITPEEAERLKAAWRAEVERTSSLQAL